MKLPTAARTQTDYRDSETQTSCFDLIVPEPWRTVQPDPWILEGCPIGFQRQSDLKRSSDSKVTQDRLLFARGKEAVPVRTSNLVISLCRKDGNVNSVVTQLEFTGKNCAVLEAFNSLSLDDLRSLESRIASDSVFDGLQFPNASVVGCGTSMECHWLWRFINRLHQGSAFHKAKPSLRLDQLEASVPIKLNERYY